MANQRVGKRGIEAVKVTASIITYNQLEPLKRALQSIQKYVDEIIVGVDDRTQDRTFTYLKEHKYNTYKFHFQDFSQARNSGLSRVTTPWVFVIDSDETILDFDGPVIKMLVKKYHNKNVDAIHFARRHWFDLEMKKEWKYPYPDRTYRLFRSNIRYAGAAHEQPYGINHGVKNDQLEIQHFNQYYRTAEEWKKANDLYHKLRGE